MSRKPIFWILTLVSLVGVVFTLRYFSEAFPIVTLNLKMDRATAMASARNLAARFQWGPEGFSQTASFELDGTVQNYVELEVGRSKAFRELLREGLYAPYTCGFGISRREKRTRLSFVSPRKARLTGSWRSFVRRHQARAWLPRQRVRSLNRPPRQTGRSA